MAAKSTNDGSLAPTTDYVFPVDLVGREGEGADAAAFNAEKKINWAKPFDERKEGYTAVKRVSPGFFRALRGALVSMKGGSAKK